jgi:hypothetical protein
MEQKHRHSLDRLSVLKEILRLALGDVWQLGDRAEDLFQNPLALFRVASEDLRRGNG